MFDRYQREIHYLRLSVTDLCNLRSATVCRTAWKSWSGKPC